LDNLREFLEFKADFYNAPFFIEPDPVSVPHLFTKKEDIEIAGFLAATIAWGNRKSIISDARRLLAMMDNDPHDFLVNASSKDLKPFRKFNHRTFNGTDCIFFLESLKNIYRKHKSMEALFPVETEGAQRAISHFRREFLKTPHEPRSEKHVSDPLKGSAAKRINMFLRWMVRSDAKGVDFGIWNSVSPASLVCPLDVHVGNTARSLGLLQRKSNDWRAAEELTANLRAFDPGDPVKFDFALFGIGAFEKPGQSFFSTSSDSSYAPGS